LQEQRIRALAGQLADAHRTLSMVESDRRARSAHVKQLEDSRRDRATTPGEVDGMLTNLRQELARSEWEEQTRRTEAQELQRMLSTEQTTWMDLNSRLDELERALPASRGR
jgi:hypothetical protein